MSLNNLYLGACGPSGFLYPPPGGLPYFTLPGLGQGSKPLALSMLSPASSVKMTPKTATVPPLSQGSPSNGLSLAGVSAASSASNSASFSAALRKLAHQAKDPQEEAAVLAAVAKHNGSPINSGSPRSTTPKRAPPPPPLLYTSQTATLNSPPVVTIAPTQTMSHPTDGRQSNDRVPSAHSTTSSYEHFNAKHERDQRPHSSHSRDDDRASAKDSSQTPTRLGAPSSSSAAREDSLSRGFHPYRPEDDLQRAAAAAAALPSYIDPTFAAYHPAFLQHHAAAYQSALRYEEMSAMERFRMMQAGPSFLPFPGGLVPHPAMHPLLSAGARYPTELLHQYPYMSPGAQAVDARTSQSTADRGKSEEERLQELEREKEREKEKREKEQEKEREREREVEQMKREKVREAEREKQRNAEHRERKDILSVPSRYVGDRDGEREREGRPHHQHQQQQHQQSNHQHHHHHHNHPHSLHRSKGGSISQGTPRDQDTSHHSSRHISRTSEAAQEKNHYLSSAAAAPHRNHDHFKYGNHSLPKAEPLSSESSRHAYHHALSHRDQSKGQPPPLISPHKSLSKGSGESAIFRPFENDRPVNSVVAKNSEKGNGGGPALPSSQPSVGGDRGHVNHVSRTDKEKALSSLPSNVRMFGSGPEGKLLNSNVLINHRIEKFDFKSLARECSSREGAPPASSELAAKAGVSGEGEDKVTASVPPISLSSLPSVMAGVGEDLPELSRLDARERLLSKARVEGRYHSESEEECELEEEEERKRERMMVIGSMVPVDVVVTPGKVAMMESLGLVTLQCKKDMQQKLFRKRRKMVRERSASPLELQDSAPNRPVPGESLHPLPAVSLEGEENSKEKIKFLLSLHLMMVPTELRKEKEGLRVVCEQIRRRRAEKMSARVRRKLEKEQQELLKALNRGCSNRKRKYDEMAADSRQQLDATGEPMTTLNQLQERHLAAARLGQEKQHQRLGDGQGAVGVGSGAEGSRTVIFPEGRDRQLSREFAEQFHESVLQSTRQKEHLQKLGPSHGPQDTAAAKPAPINNHLPPSTTSPSGDSAAPFVWPGLEKVLESYMQHRREQQAEKKILMEKCCQLHAQNVDLTKAADVLCGRLEVLREERRRKAAQREQLEEAISSLKKSLCIPR